MKAQVSVEFIVIAILLLSALAIITTVSFLRTQEIQTLTLQAEAQHVLTTAQNAINTAYLEGNGYYTNVTLPQNILGTNYSISQGGHFLTLGVQGNNYSAFLITDNILGAYQIGNNSVQNINDFVVIL